MPSQGTLSEDERMLLAHLLKAGNYRTGRVILSQSDLMNYLRLDATALIHILRNLSVRELVRLTDLPAELDEELVLQVRNDIDMLDLSYLEHGIDESEYVDSRRMLTSQPRDWNLREPISPLEAGKLFLEKSQKLRQVLQLTGSSQQPELSKTTIRELALVREKLLPFKRYILSRINDLNQQDPLYDKRLRMLLLFSQVGLGQLVQPQDIAGDLIEEVELLRARYLVGEISETEYRPKEQMLWDKVWKGKVQLPNHKAFARWEHELSIKLDAVRSLQEKGILTEDLFRMIHDDLDEDIALARIGAHT